MNNLQMECRIADSFTHCLAGLTGEEQKAVKTTEFDLQLNPAHPCLSFDKLEKAKDKNFWSGLGSLPLVWRDVRVSARQPTKRNSYRSVASWHEKP